MTTKLSGDIIRFFTKSVPKSTTEPELGAEQEEKFKFFLGDGTSPTEKKDFEFITDGVNTDYTVIRLLPSDNSDTDNFYFYFSTDTKEKYDLSTSMSCQKSSENGGGAGLIKNRFCQGIKTLPTVLNFKTSIPYIKFQLTKDNQVSLSTLTENSRDSKGGGEKSLNTIFIAYNFQNNDNSYNTDRNYGNIPTGALTNYQTPTEVSTWTQPIEMGSSGYKAGPYGRQNDGIISNQDKSEIIISIKNFKLVDYEPAPTN